MHHGAAVTQRKSYLSRQRGYKRRRFLDIFWLPALHGTCPQGAMQFAFQLLPVTLTSRSLKRLPCKQQTVLKQLRQSIMRAILGVCFGWYKAVAAENRTVQAVLATGLVRTP